MDVDFTAFPFRLQPNITPALPNNLFCYSPIRLLCRELYYFWINKCRFMFPVFFCCKYG